MPLFRSFTSVLRASLVVSVAAFVLASCGTAKGKVKLTEPVERAGQWERVLKEHTRRNQHYNWPTLEADLRVTLVTPRLRSAFIQDRSRFHGAIAKDLSNELLALGQPPDEGMDAPMTSRPKAEEQLLLFVSIFVRDADYRDLDASSSIWDIQLSRGDANVQPIAIESMRFSPALVAMLPYIDRFDEIYIMRFPLVDAATGTPMMSPGKDPLKLKISSAIGAVATEWTLVGDGSAEATVPAAPMPQKRASPAPMPQKRASPAPLNPDQPASSLEPDASEPDANEPDASEPDASEPDASEPDASEAQSSDPGSSAETTDKGAATTPEAEEP